MAISNPSTMNKLTQLADKAVTKGHEVSVKLKVKVKPQRRRAYEEEKDGKQ